MDAKHSQLLSLPLKGSNSPLPTCLRMGDSGIVVVGIERGERFNPLPSSVDNHKKRGHMTHLVAVYDVGMRYGGPEEGGWWYNAGSLVRVVKVFRSEDRAFEYCRRLNQRLNSRVFGPNQGKREYTSVLSEGELRADVYENMAPAGSPEVRPHYE